MRGHVQNLWDNVKSSLWFVPSIFVVLALAFSSILIEVDVILAARRLAVIPWLFSGTADAARTILSVVAGSLVTVISIAISLTMVALVQASAQFTPRLLRQFTASYTNQIVLGAYTGTFIYALLVLRTIRNGEENTPFVPALSVTVAVALALICLGLLIYFIHHMSQSLQVAVILDQVRHDLLEAIDHIFPEDAEKVAVAHLATSTYVRQVENAQSEQIVGSTEAGFIRRIDLQTLSEASYGSTTLLVIRPKVGDYVAHGSTLVTLDLSVDHECVADIRNAFVIDRERTTHQDALFAIRQLVDIALKALSPGINDPTTAEYALYHLNDAIGRLAGRPFPPVVVLTNDERTRIIVNRPSWDDFVDAAFGQICAAARSDAHVIKTLLDVIDDLGSHLAQDAQRDALRKLVTEVRYHISHEAFSPAVQAELSAHADRVDQALPHH